MDVQTLRHQHGLSQFVIERNIEDLTHNDSLVHPEANGNCLNWVLGHIVRTRIVQTQLLGQESPCSLEQYAAYDNEPIADTSQAIAWDTLVEHLRALDGPVARGIAALTPEQLAAKAPFSPTNNPDETIGTLLAGIAYHEAYHAGQLGLLRRVVGRPGAIGTPSRDAAAATS